MLHAFLEQQLKMVLSDPVLKNMFTAWMTIEGQAILPQHCNGQLLWKFQQKNTAQGKTQSGLTSKALSFTNYLPFCFLA